MSGGGNVVLAVNDPVLLAFAGEVGADGPVTVEGRRTRWTTGGEVAADARVVQAPIGIVEYRPEEMTVQVRAGTTVAALDEVLRSAGQRCALPDRGGTVGGAVAVGENHIDVLGRGPVRDAALQVRYISAEGRPVTGGGPVVKNVSGFNLPKLMVGSLGTLGCLAEFVLRTNPIPAASRWFRSNDVDPFAAFDAVLRPSAVLWDGATTWIHLEGHEPDVAAEHEALAALGPFTAVDGPPPLPPHQWSMAPADLRTVDADSTGPFVASIGVGRLWATTPAPDQTVDPVVTLLTDRLKTNFDPTGRLNPGRGC